MIEGSAFNRTLKELDNVGHLSLPFWIRTLKFFSHDFDDPRKGVEDCSGVEEGKAGAPSEYVDGEYGVFVSDCVAYFC